MDEIAAALAAVGFGALVGFAYPRWRILLLMPALTTIWVTGAAIDRGEDSDGAAIWNWALFFGVVATVVVSCGMVIGIVWGRWWRERRTG